MTEREFREKIQKAEKTFDQIQDAAGGGPQIKILQKAYTHIVECFGTKLRQSGELYITHCLWVAKKLADLGFSVEVIAAALLHDIVEDTDYNLTAEQSRLPYNERTAIQIEGLTRDFGEKIAALVDRVTEIKEIEKGDAPHKDWKTYAKIWSTESKYREAFYIKFVDRWHNLSDGQFMPDKSMVAKAHDTDRFLLPIAKEIGATEFYNTLGDLSLKIRNPELHKKINNQYSSISSRNRVRLEETKKLLSLTFRDDTSMVNPQLTGIRQRIKNIEFRDPTAFTIQEWQEREADSCQAYQIKDVMAGCPYPLMHVFVIFLDSTEEYDMRNMFITAYKEVLMRSLTIVRISPPSRLSYGYYILQDYDGNLYLIQLMTKSMYIQYLYGDVENAKLPTLNFDPYEDKPLITVYKRDGSPAQIEKGATALDFAFALHENIGLYTREAIINGKKCLRLETPLTNGDTVEIISDYHKGCDLVERHVPAFAKLDWFLKVTTYDAKRKLVRYFE